MHISLCSPLPQLIRRLAAFPATVVQRLADWWLEEQIGDLRLHAFQLHRRSDHEQANYFWHQAMGLELQRSPQQLARMESGEESGA